MILFVRKRKNSNPNYNKFSNLLTYTHCPPSYDHKFIIEKEEIKNKRELLVKTKKRIENNQ